MTATTTGPRRAVVPTTDAPAVVTEGLVHSFGRHRVLDGVDLRVPPGSVFGFLGPNGAGKTTTVRVLLGILTPDSGRVSVLGAPPGRARARVGFLPDVPGFYPWMSAEDFLRFTGRLFSLPEDVVSARIPALLDLAGLTGVTTKVGGYSRGMRQRLGLAQALINAPDLLLLDEPTSALDPLGRKDVLDMIESLRGRTTVVFSTHILDDAARVCDTVAILDRGRVLDTGSVQAIIARHAATSGMALVLDSDAAPLAARLAAQPWVSRVVVAPDDPHALDLEVSDRAQALVGVPRAVADAGIGMVRFDASEATLEDAFVHLVRSAESGVS